jgi:hypothetical protein
VVHEDNVADKDIKDVTFPAVEARYVKLVFTRGIRPSGEADNAIRLYGCDIYGQYVRDISRADGMIGVGKTVLLSYDVSTQLGSPLNLLTGTTDKSRAWNPSKGVPGSDPFRYVLIDLEKSYDVKRFQLYDAKSVDASATNMDAYQIFLSDEYPDLSLISPSGDENECWTKVADKKNVGSSSKKLLVLSTPTRCRFVKLVLPRTSESMNAVDAPALYAFQVYGTEAETTDALAVRTSQFNIQDSEVEYDLMGRRFDSSYAGRGIYVKGNRKVLK